MDASAMSHACPAQGVAGTGVGGNTVAQILSAHTASGPAVPGAVFEYLDTQAGMWQFSIDEGKTWRTVRTDLLNRPAGSLGLALDADARLRVLPAGGVRVEQARMVFHAVSRCHGMGNGCYRAYDTEDREPGTHSVTLTLNLGAINGLPPAVKVSRPRNKRALAEKAREAASTGTLAPIRANA